MKQIEYSPIQEGFWQASGSLTATAAYCGALFGFLQAVTAFAVQIRSQRSLSMAALTPFIARKYFSYYVLACIAGVTISNLLASFSVHLAAVNTEHVRAMNAINIFAVPMVTLSALWYLTRIIEDTGRDDIEVALPVTTAIMKAEARLNAKYAYMQMEYREVLESSGITYDPFGSSSSLLRGSTVHEIPLAPEGFVDDVDLHHLHRLHQLIEEETTPIAISISVTPELSIDSGTSIRLSWKKDTSPASPKQLIAQVKSTARHIFLTSRGHN